MIPLTHASFFTGAGGMDIGLARAGWRTVSTSEVDPYANAIIEQRFPDAPNAGDITKIGDRRGPWCDATLWSGGFPCQDISLAGRRRGLAGERSGLAFDFLRLVARWRPRAIVLENVAGLLSSNAGRDLGVVSGRLGDAGYGWAVRVLDAQWAGVPQRRRRVFILAVDLERHPAESSAGEILGIAAGCGRDHEAERAAWANDHRRTGRSDASAGQPRARNGGVDDLVPYPVDVVSPALATSSLRYAGPDQQAYIVEPADGADPADEARPADHADGGGTADGLARRVDAGRGVAYVKAGRARSVDDAETWREGVVSPTLNTFDNAGDVRATVLVVEPRVAPTLLAGTNATGGGRPPGSGVDTAESLVLDEPSDGDEGDDPRLDSHRYRVTGNGVAAPVAEWIGRRLATWLEAAS